MAEAETRDLTADELALLAVDNGRCPACGRRSEDDEHKLFKQLRDDAAKANARADKADAQVEKLKEERDQLKVRNADLRAENAELKRG